MIKEFDTIAAIATAVSNAGIGIIRISGKEAFPVIRRIFRTKSGKKIDTEKSHRVHYGFIYDGEEKLDEVLVLIMKGPHSYTAEDTVEIDCHGGRLVMQRILDLVMRSGARPAEPGEFTKRAFLNGRIDLSQAEAVMDLIQSRNKMALKSSVSQLQGSVRQQIEKLRSRILYETAFLEAALDDPEHISLDGYAEKLYKTVEEIEGEIEKLLKSSENGRILREGIKTVILGKPNAGKSSLINALMNRKSYARISATPGKTQTINFYNINDALYLVDLPGYGYAKVSEKEKVQWGKMIERYLHGSGQLRAVFLLIDIRHEPSANDKMMYKWIVDQGYEPVIIATKLDKIKRSQVQKHVKMLKEGLALVPGTRVIPFSSVTKQGRDEIWEFIETESEIN